MHIKKDNKTYTVSIDKDESADILFQNLREFPDLCHESFSAVVCCVPMCDESFDLRHLAKRHRDHHVRERGLPYESFHLMDSADESWQAHKAAGLGLDDVATSIALASFFFKMQGFEIF